MRQTVILAGAKETEPQPAVIITRDCIFRPCGNGRNGSELSALKHSKPAKARNPNATSLILEERFDVIVGQNRIGPLLIDGCASVSPPVEPIRRTYPDAPVACRQHGVRGRAGLSLPH